MLHECEPVEQELEITLGHLHAKFVRIHAVSGISMFIFGLSQVLLSLAQGASFSVLLAYPLNISIIVCDSKFILIAHCFVRKSKLALSFSCLLQRAMAQDSGANAELEYDLNAFEPISIESLSLQQTSKLKSLADIILSELDKEAAPDSSASARTSQSTENKRQVAPESEARSTTRAIDTAANGDAKPNSNDRDSLVDVAGNKEKCTNPAETKLQDKGDFKASV